MIELFSDLPQFFLILLLIWIPIVLYALYFVWKKTNFSILAKTVWSILLISCAFLTLIVLGIYFFRRTKWLLGLAILAIIGSAFSGWYYISYLPSHSSLDLSKVKATTIEATQLQQEFIMHEQAAYIKYDAKDSNIIAVNGRVEGIEKDDIGMIILLYAGEQQSPISCRMQTPVNLKAGQTVTIKGVFTGFIVGQIQLSECALVSTKETASSVPQPAADSPKTEQPIPVSANKIPIKSLTNGLEFKNTTGTIQFFSSTVAEDIEAKNNQIVSTLSENGKIDIAVLIKGFRFENTLMQKHFNQKDYMDSDQFPNSTFTGTITNIQTVDFKKESVYPVQAVGTLKIHGVAKKITAEGTISVKNATLQLKSVFYINVQDYGINGKDLAEKIKITVQCDYKPKG